MDWITTHPIEFISGCIIIGVLLWFFWGVLTTGGPETYTAEHDPHNGMRGWDIGFQEERGMIDLADITQLSEKEYQQSLGRGPRNDPITPKSYPKKTNVPYQQYREALYLSKTPLIKNGKSVPRNGTEWQHDNDQVNNRIKTQDGKAGYTWDERRGEYVRDR